METNTYLPNPLEFRHQLQPLLSPREELLWTGKPKQGVIFRTSDLFLVPFSLVWGGTATFILGGILLGVLTQGSSFPLVLLPIMLLFGGVAFYITIGRFLVDMYSRAKTTYGITNRRIIIQNQGIGGKTTSYDLKSLNNLSIEQKRNGRGTITIGTAPNSFGMGRTFGWNGRAASQPPALEQIPNAQQVYELIQDIRD